MPQPDSPTRPTDLRRARRRSTRRRPRAPARRPRRVKRTCEVVAPRSSGPPRRELPVSDDLGPASSPAPAHRRNFGSRASRSASPRRVKPSAVTAMHSAGQSASCGDGLEPVLRLRRACGPTRRRSGRARRARGTTAPPTSMIAVASTSVACTITGPRELGSMWLSTTRAAAQAERRRRPARSRRCAAASSDPRSSRAKIGTCATPMAIMTEVRRAAERRGDADGEQQARDRQQDVDQAHEERRRPSRRTPPASRPRPSPTASPISVDTTPMSSDCRAP